MVDEQPTRVARRSQLVAEGRASQEVVKRDEDGELEDQGQAGGERVHPMLLEERHLLALHALAVVFVLLLDFLDVGLQGLHLAHAVHGSEGEGQDHEAGEPGDQDDPDTPGDADVVVQPGDDRVEEILELGDDRDYGMEEHVRLLRRVEAVGSGGSRRSRPSPALRPGGRVPKQTAVRELVHAAVAERVAAQEPPAGQDQPPDRTKLANRLDRVCRAGRVVAAAGGEAG
jgi:hypothetical protein